MKWMKVISDQQELSENVEDEPDEKQSYLDYLNDDERYILKLYQMQKQRA